MLLLLFAPFLLSGASGGGWDLFKFGCFCSSVPEMVTIVTRSLFATFSRVLLLSFSIISLVIEFRCCLCGGAWSDVIGLDPTAVAAVDLPSSILIIEGALPVPVPVFLVGKVLSSFIRLTPPSTVATVVVPMLSPVGVVVDVGSGGGF